MRWVMAALMVLALGVVPSKGLSSVGDAVVVSVVSPPAEKPNAHYPSNRPPLKLSPLVKLPVGAVAARGWLLTQLELMRDGMTGHLPELSVFLREDSGWLTMKDRGWEEVPYWLKGFGDLGRLLRDERVIKETERWLDRVFASQRPDGYFGPEPNRQEPDLWPNMVMLAVLQTHYEATGDPRVLRLMSRYFQYEAGIPDNRLLPGSWQKLRGGENLESVYWLFNRTGERELLDLAARLHRRTADWVAPILSPERDRSEGESGFYHGVNIAMGFREPALFWQQTGDPGLLEAVSRNYELVMDRYGRQPGGMFAADENIRPGKNDPRQGAETCTMVEFMASFESLLKITGQAVWADRAEEIAFNSLPAAMTPDLKALHYLTAPNLISCDRSGEHDFQNSGTLLSFDPWGYRCCQHNVAFGWPYFVEHLWMATSDNGLASCLYAPSSVTAKVADGSEVTILEETDYPFGDIIRFAVSCERSVDFPLYLRIPGWAKGARISINGHLCQGSPKAGGYAVVRRTWRSGDKVALELEAPIEIVAWPSVKGSVSVRKGPLWFSLRIGESWVRYGGTDAWPAWEVLPTTPWNFGLVLRPDDRPETIRVAERRSPAAQPFEAGKAPLVLKALARRVPGWGPEGRMVGLLPQSPVEGEGPIVEVELIPMGCSRLRIAQFPVVRD